MFLLLLSVFSLSFILTGLIRHYSIAKRIIDVPNHRSSHCVPTPRGGGVGFVILFLITLPTLVHFNVMTTSDTLSLICSGFIIAGLGFSDDHGHVSAKWRLLGHFIAASFALYWLGGLPAIQIMAWTLPPAILGNLIALFYLVWLINLYNFMDGINGIASVQAISACLAMVCIYWLTGNQALIVAPLVLAVAVVGFLFWNFPVARIFMGDAGSGFLGMMLGALSIQAAWVNSAYLYCWLILMGVFIVDATVTLLRRLAQGDKIHVAHCSHAYQHAAQRLQSHTPVTLGITALSGFWLFPLALLVGLGYLEGVIGLVIAYLPLVLLTIHLKAGYTELQAS